MTRSPRTPTPKQSRPGLRQSGGGRGAVVDAPDADALDVLAKLGATRCQRLASQQGLGFRATAMLHRHPSQATACAQRFCAGAQRVALSDWRGSRAEAQRSSSATRRTQRNCSRWNDTDVFVQIARTLNLSKEQRSNLLSARQYLHARFDRCGLQKSRDGLYLVSRTSVLGAFFPATWKGFHLLRPDRLQLAIWNAARPQAAPQQWAQPLGFRV